MLPNDEVNSLAAQHCAELFGRNNVYRLPASAPESGRKAVASTVRSGRDLFSNKATFQFIQQKLREGAQLKVTSFSDDFTWNDFLKLRDGDAMVLFVIEDTSLMIAEANSPLEPSAGQTVIALAGDSSADSRDESEA